ncbi:uncharacterized protein LOC133183974 [Saccostrea echinata]|uniref:uncharacterized protein LOC133183974 n=1 Tax=Saccostrea echinata TaxID=191078 RepID=UPI002A8160CA|nr:uncharacterized protein LOC133183974 [Saccostrea echinata]
MDHFPRLKYRHQQVCKLSERMKSISPEKGNFPLVDSTTILLYVAGDITRKTERLIASTKDEGFSYDSIDQKEWPVSALIYFQGENEPLTGIKELIESFESVSWTKVFIVGSKHLRSSEPCVKSTYTILHRTKTSIREAITSFLESPLMECIQNFQKFLEKLELGHQVMRKEELSKLKKDCRSVFLLMSPEINSTNRIPDSLRKFLFQRPGIHGFGIWEASEFRIFVSSDTDTKLLKSEICTICVNFFEKMKLSIVSGNMHLKKYTKQGEKLFLKSEREDSYATTGALLKNEQGSDDIYGLTCHHALPREEQRVFAKFPESSNPFKIGECIYTDNEPNHDFAVYRVDEDKRRMCDTTFLNAMNNPCNVYIQEGQISSDALVHKKGASTDWTTGRIKSSEFYVPLFGKQSEMFLVSSSEIPGSSFSAEGDSGSVVFQHDSSPNQKSVFALGLVTGKIDDVRDESLSEAVNSTLCLRLNTALSCLSEKKQLDLKFESSSRESSSSDEVD